MVKKKVTVIYEVKKKKDNTDKVGKKRKEKKQALKR